MAHSDFVDASGTTWRIFAGLPTDHPGTADGSTDAATAGLTFRASTGEVRVLPRSAIPRHARMPEIPTRLGVRVPTTRVDAPNWEELLRHALVWPPR